VLQPLLIDQRSVAGVTILALNGPLLADEDDRLLRERVRSLTAAGERHLVLDLRHVTHIDSGGVGALIATHLHMTRRGGQLKLLCPSDRCTRVLRMTHLLEVFDVFTREDEAVRSFAVGAKC